jgi:hypothetical protein
MDEFVTCITHGPYDPFDTPECQGCISERIARDAIAGEQFYDVMVWCELGENSYARNFAVQANDANEARVKGARECGAHEVVESVELVDREYAEYVGVLSS